MCHSKPAWPCQSHISVIGPLQWLCIFENLSRWDIVCCFVTYDFSVLGVFAEPYFFVDTPSRDQTSDKPFPQRAEGGAAALMPASSAESLYSTHTAYSVQVHELQCIICVCLHSHLCTLGCETPGGSLVIVVWVCMKVLATSRHLFSNRSGNRQYYSITCTCTCKETLCWIMCYMHLCLCL